MDKEDYTHTHTHTGILAIKKETLLFVTTWMEPEDVMLSEVTSERERYHT